MLSYALWQELGADPKIIGKPLLLGSNPRTVVGVMPQGFWFPDPRTRIWTAAQMNPENRVGSYTLIGRLSSGQSFEKMGPPLNLLTQRLAQNFRYPDPQWDRTKKPSVTPVRDVLIGDVRPALLATLASMGIILIIACGNVTSLILGQADARATEIAVRAALGANHWRLIQQLVMECLLIGLLAGVVGALLAVTGFKVLVESLPLGSLVDNVRLDWTVVSASVLSALGAAVLASIIPGITVWRRGALQSAISATRVGGVRPRGGRVESVLVIAQTALVVVLVAGAGLLIRSVANLGSVHPGLEVEGIAVIDAVAPSRFNGEERRRSIEALIASLNELPDVTSVAAGHRLPLAGFGDNWGISVRGRPPLNASTAFRIVTADYFTTMRMPIRRGRNFEVGDREGSQRVVIINQAAADKFFPGEDPIGHVLETFEGGERIVGVVGNALEAGLTDGAVAARYMLYNHVDSDSVQTGVSFVLRTNASDRMASLLSAARSTISQEKFAIQRTTTMADNFDRAMGPTGQVVTLVSLLGSLALFLGAAGVYGVIWHYVVRRSRDYAIHIALGQQPSHVFLQVVGRGAGLVAAGSLAGIGAAGLVTRFRSPLLYGVDPTDTLTMSAAVVILLLVGMAAAIIPARSASATDPAAVLRQD